MIVAEIISSDGRWNLGRLKIVIPVEIRNKIFATHINTNDQNQRKVRIIIFLELDLEVNLPSEITFFHMACYA